MPKHEMIDRLSFLSTGGSLNDEPHGYHAVKTPVLEGEDQYRFEGGALREGSAPELLAKETLGLLAQYAAVGLLYGALPGTIYPLFTNYLNASGNTVVAARVLVNMPWSFKVFYGFLTDCFPICGYRRRPYMVLGWTICVVMMVIMACSKLGDPYYPDPTWRNIKPEDLTPEQQNSLNTSAQDSGGKYIVLMMFASVGYLMADVAADAVVVEYAQREPENVRGRTQTAIYTVRTVSMAFANLVMAFLFNGKDYGGDYTFTLSFPQLMTCLAIVTIPVIPITWFTIKEEYFTPPLFSHYLNELWSVIQTRAVYQIIAYKFFGGIFENFSFVASDLVQTNWAHVSPRNEKLSVILTLIVTAMGIVVTGRYGLHWNWRVITASTMVTMVVLDAICSFFVTWDIIRSQYFWLGIPVIEQFPYSIGFIVSTYVVVELAEMGNEGAIYGLLTTVNNLSDPFSKTIMKNVNEPFNLTVKNIQNDTTEVRKNVSATLIIMYVMKLLSLAWLPLLPSQKKETQMLKAHGGKSRVLGLFTVMYVAFAMVWSVSTNLMTIFPATKCLKIVGGSGCDKDSSGSGSSS